MGMGYIEDISKPSTGDRSLRLRPSTRNARNGALLKPGRLVIKNRSMPGTEGPSRKAAPAIPASLFRAYLRHLYEREEISSAVLNTIHNLHFYLESSAKLGNL